MTEITKCLGIDCAVRNTCRRYCDDSGEIQVWSPFYDTDSFRPSTGCEFYWKTPGINGRMALGHVVGADFDKARE